MMSSSFIKIVIISIALINIFAINTIAFEFVSTKKLIQSKSFLLNPTFPDVTLPDFKFKSDSSNAGINFPQNNSDASAEWADYESLHKYFGYATLALAGVAAVTSSNKNLHYGSAYGATGTALLTCLTGYSEYSDRFDLEEGILAADNLHILIGALGTVVIATAVATADSGNESSHAGMGVAGGSLMLVSVAVIKFQF